MPARELSVESFRLVGVRITDDRTQLEAAINKKQSNPVFRRWENSTDPEERLKYRNTLEAITLLKNSSVFQAFLGRHLRAYLDDVGDVLANSNTPSTIDRQVRKGVDLYYLDEAYARKCVEETANQLSGGGGTPSGPQPVLVNDLKITRHGRGLQLKWKRPAQGCDEVRLVCHSDHPPQSPTDGISKSLRGDTEYDDIGLTPGQTRYYALYSVCQGVVSPSAVSRKATMPKAVEQVGFNREGNDLRIDWRVSPEAVRVWVVYRAGGSPKVSVNADRLETSDGQILHQGAASNCLLPGIRSGQELHFHIVADFGDGLFAEGVTETYLPATPPDAPTDANARFDGRAVQLQWKPPATSVDGYVILRSETGTVTRFDANLTQLMSRGASLKDTNPPLGKRVYYGVFATRDCAISAACASDDVETPVNQTNLKAVDADTIRIYDNSPVVQLFWEWPDAACTEVLILWNESGIEPDAKAHSAVKRVSYREYNNNEGGTVIHDFDEERRRWSLFFFATYQIAGKDVHSAATKVEHPLGEGPKIYWQEVEGSLASTQRIFRCELEDDAKAIISKLVLVKRRGRTPQAIRGQGVRRVDEKEIKKRGFFGWGRAVNLMDSNPDDDNWEYGVFVEDRDEHARVQVVQKTRR